MKNKEAYCCQGKNIFLTLSRHNVMKFHCINVKILYSILFPQKTTKY